MSLGTECKSPGIGKIKADDIMSEEEIFIPIKKVQVY